MQKKKHIINNSVTKDISLHRLLALAVHYLQYMVPFHHNIKVCIETKNMDKTRVGEYLEHPH